MANKIQHRRDTAANWATANTVLSAGEPALETDTGKEKVGDGTTPWATLPYRMNRLRPLEGVPFWVYGHSFTPVPGYYCTKNGGEWASRLASRFSMVQTNRGDSGLRMPEIAAAAIGTSIPSGGGDKHYPAGGTGLVILEGEINDIVQGADQANAAYQNGFKNGLRSFLAAVTAGSRIESTAATQSGAWSTFTDSRMSGGTTLYSSTGGAYLEWTGVSAPAGYLYLLTLANDATAGPTGTMGISVDGVDQGVSYVGAGQMKQFVSTAAGGATWTFSPAVIKVTVPATGTHTIRATVSTGGNPVWVDALLVSGVNPPMILVCKDPPCNSSIANSTWTTNYNANVATYNAFIDSVVAEFPGVVTVDLAPGWNGNTMAGLTDANHVHPGDRGMGFIADVLTTKLQTLLTDYRSGLNIL